jgi:hypothetical protein
MLTMIDVEAMVQYIDYHDLHTVYGEQEYNLVGLTDGACLCTYLHVPVYEFRAIIHVL